MKTEPKGELYPRHIKALARALREAESWRGAVTGTSALGDLDKMIADARQALREVREVAKQHGYARKYTPWLRAGK